jgi:hypothetical protein
MNVRHIIRLHAAWKRVIVGLDGEGVLEATLNEPTTVTLPDSFLAGCHADFVTMSRRFNRPTGLDDGSTVVLDCGLLPCADSAVLNGTSLGPNADGTADITDLLRPHNELEMTISKERFAAASVASARLLIVDRECASSEPV